MISGRSFPVWLGTGFGLGSGWTDCERSFNPVAIPGVRILPSIHHPSAPSTGTPSVMERLSEKTSGLVDKGKSKSSQIIDATRSKSNELIDEGKDKGREALDKGKEKARQVEDKVRSV
jgi:inner membrane organizing system protein 1